MKAIVLFAAMIPAMLFAQQQPMLIEFVEANVRYEGGMPVNRFTTEFQIAESKTAYTVSFEGATMTLPKSTCQTQQFADVIVNRFGDKSRKLYLTIDFSTGNLLFVNFIVSRVHADGNEDYVDWVQWFPGCKEKLTRSTAGK
jgi:hypothetical protein